MRQAFRLARKWNQKFETLDANAVEYFRTVRTCPNRPQGLVAYKRHSNDVSDPGIHPLWRVNAWTVHVLDKGFRI